MNTPPITLTLSRRELLALMKAVYMGNWVANAHKVDDFNKEISDIEERVFHAAFDAGFRNVVEEVVDKKNITYAPNSIFESETEVHELIDEYDNETFWDELTEHLARRDIVRSHGDTLETMDFDEFHDLFDDHLEAWSDELETHGLERFVVAQ